VKFTTPRPEQTSYIGVEVEVEGPYKPDHYHYRY
jgi:hypothetical protein